MNVVVGSSVDRGGRSRGIEVETWKEREKKRKNDYQRTHTNPLSTMSFITSQTPSQHSSTINAR